MAGATYRLGTLTHPAPFMTHDGMVHGEAEHTFPTDHRTIPLKDKVLMHRIAMRYDGITVTTKFCNDQVTQVCADMNYRSNHSRTRKYFLERMRPLLEELETSGFATAYSVNSDGIEFLAKR